MSFSQSKDESLLAFYENVRRQVELDSRAGGRHRLIGEGVKQYAEQLRDEMDRRRLRYKRIDWPTLTSKSDPSEGNAGAG
jgi:hypothetical protein